MTLLCATNFSPEAITASTVAAELARQRGEQLWLVFVVPAHAAKIYGEDALASADARLTSEAERLRKFGATVTPAVLIGKLDAELPRFARENGVSLVIAGDSSVKRGSAGSVGRLGRQLEMPLLTVRNAAPLIAWAKGERPLKVMVGVDETRSTTVAARFVEALAKFGRLELTGGHVYFPAAESHRFGLPPPAHWDDVSPELTTALHRELHAQLPASIPHRIVLKAAIGRVSDHLCALAEEERADLLVLGTHHRRALGRLWSVSEQCLPQAAMSVVCVPATGAPASVERPIAVIERVLIATDLSPGGDRAIAWGLGALPPGGMADLIHVVTEKPTEAAEARILEQLTDRIPAEASDRGLTVEVHVIQALTPGAGICAAAERFASAAIAVASRSSRVAKALFGSTTLAVLEASRRPVLIVPPPEA